MDKKIHLNVYYDPWINTIYCDEHKDVLSLRDCLVQATDIKSLYIKDAQYALDQTVPYTLLTMLLARVFHPDHDEKFDMFDEGSFDVDKVDDYIRTCENQGISFDVFDDNRPFLQDPDYKSRKKEDETSTVGILDPLMVSGNNTVFYHNKNYNTGGNIAVENALYMTPPQFIASVARNHMYHNWSGGSCSTGYTPSQPPLHCIIHGKNLFETLIISIPPNAHGVPLWERQYDMTIPEIESTYRITLDYLSAAFLPTISVHFGEVTDGVVKNVYYSGNIYKGRESSKPKEFTSKFFVKENTGINLFLVKNQKQKDEIVPLKLDATTGIQTIMKPADIQTIMKTTDISIMKILITKDFNETGDYEFLQNVDFDRNVLNYVVYGGKLSEKSDEPQSMIMEISIPTILMKENGTDLKKIAIYAVEATIKLAKYLLSLEQEIQNDKGESVKSSGAVWTIVRHFSEYASDQLTQLHNGTWLYRIVNDRTEKTVDEIIEEINKEAMNTFYSYRTKYILESGKYASYLHVALYGKEKNNDAGRKAR